MPVCEENGISSLELEMFYKIRRSALRHETLLKISRILLAIKSTWLRAIIFCFPANVLNIGDILNIYHLLRGLTEEFSFFSF